MNSFLLVIVVGLLVLAGASCTGGSKTPANLYTPADRSDPNTKVMPPSKANTTTAVEPTSIPIAPKAITPAPKPSVTLEAAQLVGGWSVIKAQTSFESITLIADGTYISHLYDRPFDSGKWALSGTTLTLTSDAGSEMNKIFTKVSLEGNRLRANDGVIPMIWQKGK